jgi:hypothetical protein
MNISTLEECKFIKIAFGRHMCSIAVNLFILAASGIAD